ncbi:MAG TPA: ATP-binding protein [Pyrinomonadaceae bacterium]|nr:ATP-binding protein [Pyrinomonadaceae bacterium]
MLRSLFLKIFLWFGLVMLTVIFGTFLVGELLRPERSEQRTRRPLEPILNIYGKDAAEEYERGGQTSLNNYLDNAQRQSNLRLFIFDNQMRELLGRRIPADAPDVARKVFETRLPEFSNRDGSPLLARPVRADSGTQYVLVAELPPPPQSWMFHPVVHMLAVGLMGGLFCYGLARYLTSPVTKLRAATRELARGNLRARVVPALGGRRDELASLAVDFDEMAEKIQLLLDSQRRLLGDISHELRSPLARLNVALELARQRSGETAQSALERIQREAETLNEMIGQLLALTRMESGAEEISKTEFDLSLLLQEIVTDAEFEAQARNRSVKLCGATNVTVNGVPNLLRRAIENVVRNAVHHTAEGTQVEIELLDAAASELENAPPGSGARLNGANARFVSIVVRDHGPGVPAEALAEIFRPFYRVDEARDREAGGVGLGLAIAERAVRLHGGIIAASNAPDGGLLVTITLPSRKSAAD